MKLKQSFQVRNRSSNGFEGLRPNLDGLNFFYFSLSFLWIIPKIGSMGGRFFFDYFGLFGIVVKDSPSGLRGDSEWISVVLRS